MGEPTPSDADLHIRVIGEDETALVLIDSRYQAVVTGWARKRGLPPSEAEAAWNEALLSFWDKAAGLNPVGCVKPYVFRVMRNKVADYYRSKDTLMHPKDVNDIPATSVARLHQPAVETDLTPNLQQCLDQLTTNHRQAVDLVVLHGMMVRDAAEVIGAPPNTVSKWTSRGLEQLRKCAEDNDER